MRGSYSDTARPFLPTSGYRRRRWLALRDFRLPRPGLSVIRSVLIDDNRLSRRAVLLGGGRIIGTSRVRREDGTEVAVVNLELRRAEWEAMLAQSERSQRLDVTGMLR